MLKGVELARGLKLKLIEEVNEVCRASTASELLEELADLQEVMNALITASGFTQEELEGRMHEKREEKGAFEQGYWLEYVVGQGGV